MGRRRRLVSEARDEMGTKWGQARYSIWLEQNKAYLQNKLPGFETPKYMVVIGRGTALDATAKAYLRSYNRDWKNIELLSFDDVLVRFNGVISALDTATSP